MKKASFKWYEEGKPDNNYRLLDKKKCKQQFLNATS
jgi:hypothetical protein